MIRYNISIWRTRQAELATGTPLISREATRWSGRRGEGQRRGGQPSAVSLGAATLLHLAAALLLLILVHHHAVPTALDDQAVALIFAPDSAPHAEPPPAPTVAPITPAAPPEPPPPPEAPAVAAIPPSPPDAAAPTDAPPQPMVPPPPPSISAPAPPLPTIETRPPAPVPPPPPHRPPPQPRPAARPRGPTATASRPPPTTTAPAQAAPPPAPSPAPANPAPDTPPTATGAAPIAADWQRAVFGWLAAHQTYPEEARRRGEAGSVALRFTVDPSGKVLEVTLVSGSGSPRLDDAAQAMLRHASLPPFPANMSQEPVTVTVQIRYRLTE